MLTEKIPIKDYWRKIGVLYIYTRTLLGYIYTHEVSAKAKFKQH